VLGAALAAVVSAATVVRLVVRRAEPPPRVISATPVWLPATVRKRGDEAHVVVVHVPFRRPDPRRCGKWHCDSVEDSLRNWNSNWLEAGGAAVNGELATDTSGLVFEYFFTGETTGLPPLPIVHGWLPSNQWQLPQSQWLVAIEVGRHCLTSDRVSDVTSYQAEVVPRPDGSILLTRMGIADAGTTQILCTSR
jgi:hypothetical protein